MLDELVVRNLGVIEDARLCPGPGFNVISGETGAGKTLLVGALRLLVGGEAASGLVGPFGDEAAVEARFVERRELVVGRRLPRQGRSRSYLDGSIASAPALSNALEGSVDIIGQHDQLSLTRPAEVLALVDAGLDTKGRRLLQEHRRVKSELASSIEARSRLGGDQRALARELDLVRFQADEIARAGFKVGDEEELELDANRLRHAATLTEHLAAAAGALDEAGAGAGRSLAELRKAARLDPSLEGLVEQSEFLAEAVTEMGRDLRMYTEAIVADPEQQELAEARLTLLGELKRKYGHNLDEVLMFGKEAEARSAEIARLLDRVGTVDIDIARLEAELDELAASLRAARKKAGTRLCDKARSHLLDLGFTDPSLKVEVDEDRVRLLFASDARLTPGEVDRVASGGELSRLVLALRLAAGAGSSSVLVFDEIDAGIGGATALAMGKKLAALAASRQILCVTHLPQVAAFASSHFIVERDADRATLRQVEGDERTTELARMLAGLPDSERGREAAAELVELAAELLSTGH